MRSALAAAALSALLLGCEPQDPLDLLACEEATKALLKAPSTYKRVDLTRTDARIFINYDAANSFGTPIRGLVICDFTPGTTAKDRLPELIALTLNGRKLSGNDIDFMLASAKAQRAVMKK